METGQEQPSPDSWRFNRHEVAGAFGDLGVLLPIAIGLIILNGLNPVSVLLGIGIYYIVSGLYFRVTVPVQPMKVIGAYAIAMGMTPLEVSASGLWIGLILLVLAGVGAISLVGRLVPKPTIRAVQLTTGVLLFRQGVHFIAGTSSLQQSQESAEPFLSVTSIGPIEIGLILGIGSVLTILFLLDSKRAPAALVVLAGGITAGLLLGAYQNLSGFSLGLHLPDFLPYGTPDASLMLVGLTALALPQLPMTVGNAVIAQADLTQEYFGEEGSRRVTHRALAISMGLANSLGALIGAMPMCHGAGGLAAHYRFGARTMTGNVIVGLLFVGIGLFVGDQAVALFSLIPFAVLGGLLIFAGAQLALTILDITERNDLFVVITVLAVSLVSNLAVGFGIGLALTYLFRTKLVNI